MRSSNEAKEVVARGGRYAQVHPKSEDPDDPSNHPAKVAETPFAKPCRFSEYLPFSMAYAILNGMTLKADKAGRVILPKPVRDRLGLAAGSDLEMIETVEGTT